MLPQVRARFETLQPGKLTMAHLYLLLLLLGGHIRTVQWMQSELLYFMGGRWHARWASGLSLPFPPPGYGTITDGQSLERMNGVIKQGLPSNVHLLSLTTATPHLEHATRALMCRLDAKSLESTFESQCGASHEQRGWHVGVGLLHDLHEPQLHRTFCYHDKVTVTVTQMVVTMIASGSYNDCNW